MQRLDLQFYAFFMIVLCGASLGLLFDLLRVARGQYQPNRWVGAMADLLFWGVATVALSGALFYGNWGDLRFYVLVGLLVGIGLYYWLASPLTMALTRLVLWVLEWLTNLVASLVLKLVWAPLVWIAGMVWGGLVTLWRWLGALGRWVWRLLDRLGGWLLTPLIGPYRFMRLHYLLAKRRLKRRLRHWLLGPPRPTKR
ncbi:MAG TPA: spore cortex biosynthesis protein YabQ [Symbiobacteriaceae bacterium]|nr:spore cortex biosynthesis protein YabQ [Symbiobacteriaceae bacterium]